MSDLISRQAAIDALEKRTGIDWKSLKILVPMLEVLEELPTIEAEPVKSGRWEYKHFSSEPHCSLCLAEYPIETNYCPNCGAKMDGGAR